MIKSLLVDARNYDQVVFDIINLVTNAKFIGLDIETEDSRKHAGLTKYCNKKRLVFDTNRTTVCGLSLWPEDNDTAYYFNMAHADVQNRLTWEQVKRVLDARSGGSNWVIHNAPFEIVMMKKSLNYILTDVICSLQALVSAYGPDEYKKTKFIKIGMGGMGVLEKDIVRTFSRYSSSTAMTADQEDLFNKIIAKNSIAHHSYNGLIRSISYGYGLKMAVKSWFHYDMTTFDQVLNGKAHMGQLTGDEVVAYGADDAYWCVRLLRRTLEYMYDNNPDVVKTFFNQENPMAGVYAELWGTGIRINHEAMIARSLVERAETAKCLRKLKTALSHQLGSDSTKFLESLPNPKLVEYDNRWYRNCGTYRQRLISFVDSNDSDDDFTQCYQVSGAVSSSWAEEKGLRKSSGPNFTHYMMTRITLFDLCGLKAKVLKGKIQSDNEAKGKLLEQVRNLEGHANIITIIECLNTLSSIEQRVKLYLTPYKLMADPETNRIYPVISSKLSTRRLAGQYPNPMQLAKNSESSFIRSYYLPDNDNHLMVSLDWSGIELVEIGEFSEDPEFKKAFGQIPYEDLHSGAAAAALELNEKDFLALKNAPDDFDVSHIPFDLVDDAGTKLTPKQFFKFARREIGKGANFNYWYSGALSTVGQKLGWSPDHMWAATKRYRDRFQKAEEWRISLINYGKGHGYVSLPDHHRRVKYEATADWQSQFTTKFSKYRENSGVMDMVQEAIRKIQTRAKNQLVNAYIQGTCATIIKRSILRINDEIKKQNLDARILTPIHDELVFTVHYTQVLQLINLARKIMCTHQDIFPTLPLHCTASMGSNLQPYHETQAPFGQIELDEAPKLPFLSSDTIGTVLNISQIKNVIQYLMGQEIKESI